MTVHPQLSPLLFNAGKIAYSLSLVWLPVAVDVRRDIKTRRAVVGQTGKKRKKRKLRQKSRGALLCRMKHL